MSGDVRTDFRCVVDEWGNQVFNDKRVVEEVKFGEWSNNVVVRADIVGRAIVFRASTVVVDKATIKAEVLGMYVNYVYLFNGAVLDAVHLWCSGNILREIDFREEDITRLEKMGVIPS